MQFQIRAFLDVTRNSCAHLLLWAYLAHKHLQQDAVHSTPHRFDTTACELKVGHEADPRKGWRSCTTARQGVCTASSAGTAAAAAIMCRRPSVVGCGHIRCRSSQRVEVPGHCPEGYAPMRMLHNKLCDLLPAHSYGNHHAHDVD